MNSTIKMMPCKLIQFKIGIYNREEMQIELKLYFILISMLVWNIHEILRIYLQLYSLVNDGLGSLM